ncbi:MAG: BCCT family transporter [Myxococcota bacterium]|nr:BCCT family transporter [Myxococcota bacterium]
MKQIDGRIFALSVGFLLLVTLPLALAPEASGRVISVTYDWLALHLGPLYLWAGVGTLGFSLYLALGRYGRVVLGQDDEAPEFSNLSWFAMLFCAGIASGLLYWGVIEWAYYFRSPPYGAEVGSPEAILWATSYPLFHWGLTAWGFYALPTVAVAYACHRRGETAYRLSKACRPVLGDHADRGVGRFIDVLFMVGILGGASTSLGLSTPLIAEGVAELTGVVRTFSLDIGIVISCSVIFAISVYAGLERGIRILSDLNLILALALVAFIFIAGDTLFIVKMSTAAVGHALDNFIRMNLWTDPISQTGFVEDWTIFYWAWWIAYAPFVGLFVARISRGRSIRQVVLGMLILGTAGSWLFFMILGNYALSLELSQQLPVLALLEEKGAPATIVAIILSLPFGSLALGLFCLVALLYLATTFDSAAYTLAAGASSDLGPLADPSRGHRSFWAVALALLPIALLGIGGLRSLQTASLVASVPLLGVGCLLAVSLRRALREDFG